MPWLILGLALACGFGLGLWQGHSAAMRKVEIATSNEIETQEQLKDLNSKFAKANTEVIVSRAEAAAQAQAATKERKRADDLQTRMNNFDRDLSEARKETTVAERARDVARKRAEAAEAEVKSLREELADLRKKSK